MYYYSASSLIHYITGVVWVGSPTYTYSYTSTGFAQGTDVLGNLQALSCSMLITITHYCFSIILHWLFNQPLLLSTE